MNGNFLYNKAEYLRWKQDHMKMIWKYFSVMYTSYLVLYSQKSSNFRPILSLEHSSPPLTPRQQ